MPAYKFKTCIIDGQEQYAVLLTARIIRRRLEVYSFQRACYRLLILKCTPSHL